MNQEREAVACAERIVERTYNCGELEIEAKIVAKAFLALRSGGEGWRLVPVEPTPEMVEAHDIAHAKAATILAPPEDIWTAMLAAAPSPSTQGEG